MEDRDVKAYGRMILTRIATRLTAVVASTAPDEPPDWWIAHIDASQITQSVEPMPVIDHKGEEERTILIDMQDRYLTGAFPLASDSLEHIEKVREWGLERQERMERNRMTVAKAKFLRLIRWRAFYAEVLLGECSR